MVVGMNYDLELAKKLTILTSIYGRVELTLRHLLYLEAVRCPFKVYLADGSLDDQNLKIIEANKHRFSHVAYEYHRYQPGAGLANFYKKMADASGRITTPYVLWYDEDDFFDIEAILQCIAFLEQDAKQEYIGCMGQIIGFMTHHDEPFQPIVSGCRFAQDPKYELDSIYDRITGRLPDDHCMHSVLRTNYLQEIFQLEVALNCNNFLLNNYIEQSYLPACGKIKRLPQDYFYKQVGGQSWFGGYEFILEVFLANPAYDAFHRYAQILAKMVCDQMPELEPEAIAKDLIKAYIDFNNPKTLRAFLKRQFDLGTAYWANLSKFLHRYHLLAFKQLWRFPRTLRVIHFNPNKTLSIIKQVLNTKAH
ncbi:MAG TPA: hypothetical protein DEW74_01465 [Opitutae bacterium]|nr:hypothetical protein [Opitutae bacterium]